MVLETGQAEIWPVGSPDPKGVVQQQHRPPLPAGDAFFTWSTAHRGIAAAGSVQLKLPDRVAAAVELAKLVAAEAVNLANVSAEGQ